MTFAARPKEELLPLLVSLSEALLRCVCLPRCCSCFWRWWRASHLLVRADVTNPVMQCVFPRLHVQATDGQVGISGRSCVARRAACARWSAMVCGTSACDGANTRAGSASVARGPVPTLGDVLQHA